MTNIPDFSSSTLWSQVQQKAQKDDLLVEEAAIDVIFKTVLECNFHERPVER
jgi:hypothetical protein